MPSLSCKRDVEAVRALMTIFFADSVQLVLIDGAHFRIFQMIFNSVEMQNHIGILPILFLRERPDLLR